MYTSNKQRSKLRTKINTFLINNPLINPFDIIGKNDAPSILNGLISALPEFLIIGQLKCGTTSLYDYLTQHPDIQTAFRKEIGFFLDHYTQGLTYYRSYFLKRRWNKNRITGEASPLYFSNPLCLPRIRQTLPNVKLIVILRNPTYRAYSHYWMNVTKGKEDLSFEQAIEKEHTRIRNLDETIQSADRREVAKIRYSYTRAGLYIQDITRWLNVYSKEQILILDSEELKNNVVSTINKTFRFLGIRKPKEEYYDHISDSNNRKGIGTYTKQMKDETKLKLDKYFEPYNEELHKYLGMKFSWM